MHKRRILSAIAVLLCIASLVPQSLALGGGLTLVESDENSELKITVLDLPDGGDCTIIRYGDKQILVDSGENTKSNWELIKQNLSQELSETDTVWDYVIFSHPDSDHIGNAGSVLNFFSYKNDSQYSIGNIIDYDFEDDTTGLFKDDAINYRKDRKAYCDSNKCSYFSASTLSESTKAKDFSLGPNCTLSVLFNFYDNIDNHTQSTNNISVCFLIEYETQKMLFTGDLEQSGENKLKSYHEDKLKNVTFFKAGHHGSKTSNTEEFIDVIRPCYVAITGMSNANLGDESLNNFLKYTDYIYPTKVKYMDDNYKLFGTTVFEFSGNTVTTSSENNSSVKSLRDAEIIVFEQTINWFDQRVADNDSVLTDSVYVYSFDEGKASYSNCTLFKYGHVDILIDCGSTASSSTIFVDNLKRYVTDGIIEYVIVTHFHTANISQLIGSDSTGVFDQYKIGCLIDSSVSNLPTNSVNGFYGRYLETTETNPNIGEKICLKGKERREISVVPNRLGVTLLAGSINSSGDEDDCSMSVMITFRDNKFLFVGDLTDFSNLSAKVNISNICFYRASNSTISYSDSNLRDSYLETLKLMNPKYAVIGSALNYRMPNGALFGSYQYRTFLLNNCTNVYCTGEVTPGNEYLPINGTLVFSLKYKPSYSDREMFSMRTDKNRTPVELSKW